MRNVYKADLHVHSRYSNKPSIWALRKFNCPESYTSPLFIYDTARKKGMDYVTITDHNSINGALEIAHLPGTFISAEVTTYLPENGCKLHVVALDITENMFSDIMHLRTNIYDLVAYLRKEGAAHFIAHPLYNMNGRLSLEVIEKLLLLFEVVEVKNGARAKRYNELVETVVASLTKETIEALADKHGISPSGQVPWRKAVVGGSDDHSGFFIGRAYTAAPKGETVKDFIESIKKMDAWAAGEDGDVLTLAHSIYGIGYRFFKERVESKRSSSFPFINALMDRVYNTNQGKSTLFDRINLRANALYR